MRERGWVVVFAKAPAPGRVKTRMTPPLSPAQAAELYAALLADALAATAAWARELDLLPIVAVQPASARGELARTAPAAFRAVAQRGADLAARMEWAVREAGAAGARRILLRGSDSPALGPAAAAAALEALDGADLALSPDRDGGYNLVALRRPWPGLFSHPMSTPTVLDDTRSRARERGMRVSALAPSFDLDAVDDLPALARARDACAPLCPRTLDYLDRHDLWRLAERS